MPFRQSLMDGHNNTCSHECDNLTTLRNLASRIARSLHYHHPVIPMPVQQPEMQDAGSLIRPSVSIEPNLGLSSLKLISGERTCDSLARWEGHEICIWRLNLRRWIVSSQLDILIAGKHLVRRCTHFVIRCRLHHSKKCFVS
jgi:hypothetical protein